MTPNQYQELAARTECDQTRSLGRMANLTFSSTKDSTKTQLTAIRLNHSLIGIVGEAGEIAAELQRWIYYGKSELELTHLAEEYGDLLWYIAEGLNAVGLSMETVMTLNIAKLKARYPEKYTDYHAAEGNRDRAKEADVMQHCREQGTPQP